MKKLTELAESLQYLTLMQILYLWIAIGVWFAVIYYILSFTPQGSLLYLGKPVGHGLSDCLTVLYFSFVTFTSTGYGDVVPLGISKILSIIEIFLGLVVFGFLISKLVSTRQERVIEELYDMSFEEKVNRLRSTLSIYRANISRIIDRITVARLVKKSDIIDLEASFEGLKSGMNRIRRFLISENKNAVTKVDELTFNLLLNSLNLSLTRMIETINLLNTKRYDWKKSMVLKYILSCINSIKEIREVYEKKQLKDELKALLRTLDDYSKQLEDITK